MAASDTIENMYDVALKPRLLRSLLKEYVPDLKHQFRNPSVLSYVVSAVKTHRLLSELAPPESDQKLIENWTSTVDSWINRVVALASSDTPDKCWAGICLLGVTYQECSRERFLASYVAWFNTLLLHLQSPADSHFVKVASCASLSDLFTRLSGLPNAKKDGISLGTKLIQPLLKLLNEDTFDAEEAIFLLCTILDIFPSSIPRHYDGVENAVVLRLMSGKCSPSMLKKLGYCLALLPKSRGDEDSWLLMMQKIMLLINIQLNDAFRGLEQETRSTEAMRLLLPPGKDPPPPLGGQSLSSQTSDKTMRPEHLQISRISTLIFCCCKLLTTSYPFQVSMPVRSLIALAQRVLMVDGSSSPSMSYMTTMKQEVIYSELPVLHSRILDLLTSTVKGLGSQLLPHVASIIRLLTNYFEVSALPELRIKVYTIMKVLLKSLGVGISTHLTDVIVNNALMDLDERDISSVAQQKLHPETMTKTSHKKRKHASASSSLEEQPDRDVFEVEMSPNMASLSVKIAALEALEALLSVGGSWRPESWRANVDHLLLHVTRNACKGGWANDDRGELVPGSPTTTWGDYQIAALRALLASLISPGRTRPQHLSQGLALFRRGTQEIGTKVSECCVHALLALEVLIHPRALPLLDPQSTDNNYEVRNKWFSGNLHISDHAANNTFHIGMFSKAPDEPDSYNDDLYENWLRNGEDSDTVAADPGKDTDKSNQPPETLRDTLSEKVPSFDTTAIKVSESSKLGEVAPVTVAKKGPMDRDEVMVESQLSETIASIGDGKNSFQSSALVSGGNVLNPMGSEVQAEKLVLGAKSDVGSLGSEKFTDNASRKEVAEASIDGSASMLNLDRGKGLMHESDNESMESIPDIVDVEPDSD
ncbi:PREDICTED: proline-, glutamic acid- and leucine-rich protein 1 isoform X2 [Nicotiana attenuata]|uniref:proline-, glutamic acid- and leucine-rich protein 1 isoform X2 n=1 Tax=Nicotiana attenuata TaxID=49451 RepID=UPI0009048496|nr:PREDICTED: proline-, glutamic acid- and leucine-rich protein 1 isoform X2 [Nicotiana attenuata]